MDTKSCGAFDKLDEHGLRREDLVLEVLVLDVDPPEEGGDFFRFFELVELFWSNDNALFGPGGVTNRLEVEEMRLAGAIELEISTTSSASVISSNPWFKSESDSVFINHGSPKLVMGFL